MGQHVTTYLVEGGQVFILVLQSPTQKLEAELCMNPSPELHHLTKNEKKVIFIAKLVKAESLIDIEQIQVILSENRHHSNFK